MRCEQLEDIVFSGRKPDEREREEMRAHAETCEACRVLMERSEYLMGARRLDDDVELPESFARGWRRAVRGAPKENSVLRLLRRLTGTRPARVAAYAACAAILLGVGAQLGRITPIPNSAATYDLAPQSVGMKASGGVMLRSMAGTASEEAYDAGGAYDDAAESEAKILRTARLELSADDLDVAVASIQARVQDAGGRVTSCDVYTDGETRYAALELSIPDGELDAFLEGTGELGDVTRTSSSETDMTAGYQDNASRLESARAQKQRLDELYAQAESMEDIVAITNALFEVQQQIDRLEGANRSIDERAANARVSLTITGKAQKAQAGSFLARLGDQAREGLAQLGAFLEGIVLFAAWALPWLALAALLAAAAYAAGRFIRRRKM